MYIAICDDEQYWLNKVEEYIGVFQSETNQTIISDIFYSGEELLKHYTNTEVRHYDIIIIDIELQCLSGIETANRIRELDDSVVIFFLTSHTKYIRDCFYSLPLHFWDKPLSYQLFHDDMIIAINKINSIKANKGFSFSANGVTYRIPYNKIMYFSAELKKIAVHAEKNCYEFYGTFKNYKKTWEDNGFVCCHRSYYVNPKCISYLEADSLYLNNGERLPISQSHQKALKNYLLEIECADIEQQIKGKRDRK